MAGIGWFTIVMIQEGAWSKGGTCVVEVDATAYVRKGACVQGIQLTLVRNGKTR